MSVLAKDLPLKHIIEEKIESRMEMMGRTREEM
jgi:hypothetical protein